MLNSNSIFKLVNKVISTCLTHKDNLPDITIETESLTKFSKQILTGETLISDVTLFQEKYSLTDFFHLTLIFNAINFCYWAEKENKKWSVKINDKLLDGSEALIQLLGKRFSQDKAFFEWKNLTSMTLNEFQNIFHGSNVEIPMFEQRYNLLISLTRNINHSYGDTASLIKLFENKAEKLLEIINNLDSFKDESIYKGKKVIFLKRAQLHVKMYSDYLEKSGLKPLDNIEILSAFADYKVPQLLRHLGILKYSDKLAQLVDNYSLIEKDSDLENQIRIGTILAIELIKQNIIKGGMDINSSTIDGVLWSRAASNKDAMKPYHRTYTIAY